MKKRDISVVICVKNRANLLERLLKSLQNHERVLEIIVVDGNSTDSTLEIAKRYTKRVYSDNGRGLATARNIGLIHARGDYIAFIDSDVELPNNYVLSELVNELEKKKWEGIHAKIISSKTQTLLEFCEDIHLKYRLNQAKKIERLPLSAAIIKREAALNVKFDPYFSIAAEDSDFWVRFRKKGYKYGVSENVVVYHSHRASLREFIKQKIGFGRGRCRFVTKHGRIVWLLTPLGLIPYGILVTTLCKKCRKCIGYYLLYALTQTYGILLEAMNIIFKK